VLHAFATGDARRLSDWARSLAPPAPTTTFFNFLASHDGIGVVPATGMLTQTEVLALCAQVERHGGRVAYKTNPDGTQSPYELNCTWFDALTDPGADEPVTHAIDRFISSQAIMLALQGVPGIYIHSLLGSPNDHAGLAQTGRFRTLNREKWLRGELEQRIADPQCHEGAVLRRMVALIRTRRSESAFHPNGFQRVLDLGVALFALERHAPTGDSRVVCLHNTADAPQVAQLVGSPGVQYTDLIGGGVYRAGDDGKLTLRLAPYQATWLKVGH
jgi:sucrose phosphorylase